MSVVSSLLAETPVLRTAFEEQQNAIRSVWKHAEEILRVDDVVSEQFRCTIDPLPEKILSLENNMFSTVFLAVLQPLGVAPERRRLYGKLNHLFRSWVTSADNLLDDEDKVTFPVRLPGNARVMRQVVVIMLADRILYRILAEALAERVLSPEEARRIADESLRVLLPSAAEEGFEEGGLEEWPEPDYVLNELHPLKTGILFYIPFLGPERIEKGIDREKLAALKRALMDFGIGCQMLDDIRDLARDYIQRRANYVIASLLHGSHAARARQLLDANTQNGDVDQRLDQVFPDETAVVCKAAARRLRGSFQALDGLGFEGFGRHAQLYTTMLIHRLDLAHLVDRASE
jgi:hypothetical protein